ncbi:MAG: type II toxin-antitoxin system Phd/YefM family antitoxin [Pseudonocardiaceae bacterium]
MSGTTMSLSEAKARLSELGRRVSEQHERITVTRNGEAQFVLISLDDLEGLEITLDVLSDHGAVERIAESLASLESGDSGATVAELRVDPAQRRA